MKIFVCSSMYRMSNPCVEKSPIFVQLSLVATTIRHCRSNRTLSIQSDETGQLICYMLRSMIYFPLRTLTSSPDYICKRCASGGTEPLWISIHTGQGSKHCSWTSMYLWWVWDNGEISLQVEHRQVTAWSDRVCTSGWTIRWSKTVSWRFLSVRRCIAWFRLLLCLLRRWSILLVSPSPFSS